MYGLLMVVVICTNFSVLAQDEPRTFSSREIRIVDELHRELTCCYVIEAENGVQFIMRGPSVGLLISDQYLDEFKRLAMLQIEKDVELFELDETARAKLQLAVELQTAENRRAIESLCLRVSEVGIDTVERAPLGKKTDGTTAEIQQLAMVFAHSSCSLKSPETVYSKVLAGLCKWQPRTGVRPFSSASSVFVMIQEKEMHSTTLHNIKSGRYAGKRGFGSLIP